jgi:hypothetical protein
MVASMKVTIEIADAVLAEAKDFALREGTTLDALAESGMRQILSGERENVALAPQHTLVDGEALQPSVRDGWDHIGAAFGEPDA